MTRIKIRNGKIYCAECRGFLAGTKYALTRMECEKCDNPAKK